MIKNLFKITLTTIFLGVTPLVHAIEYGEYTVAPFDKSVADVPFNICVQSGGDWYLISKHDFDQGWKGKWSESQTARDKKDTAYPDRSLSGDKAIILQAIHSDGGKMKSISIEGSGRDFNGAYVTAETGVASYEVELIYKSSQCAPYQKQLTEKELEEKKAKKYLKISDMLWPASRSWFSVKNAPNPSAKILLSLKSKLIASYKANAPDSVMVVEYMFPTIPNAGSDWARSFYWIDINHDGLQDIVYAGYWPLSAGSELSVIWYAKNGDYEVGQKPLIKSGLLRVSPSGKAFTSVAPGCCDARGDEYFFGGKSIYLLKDMDIPSKLFKTPKAFINDNETILRSAPLENNTHDKGLSEYLEEVVLGNQIQLYRAKASGVVLAQQKDKQGKIWNFVRMNDSSRILLTRSLYGNKTSSQAGWVRIINSSHKSTVQKSSAISKGRFGTPTVKSVTLSNDFTGMNKCLVVSSGNQVRLATCQSRGGSLNKGGKSPERWYQVPTNQTNDFYLKHGSPDSNQCLSLNPDTGVLFVDACQNYNDQVWYTEPWDDNQPGDRVHNAEAGSAYCLDVINDHFKNKVQLAECGNYNGQAWYIASGLAGTHEKATSVKPVSKKSHKASQIAPQYGNYTAIHIDRKIVKSVIIQGKDIYVEIPSKGNITVRKSAQFNAAYSNWYKAGLEKKVGISNSNNGKNKKGYTWRINISAKFVEYYLNKKLVLHLKRN